MKKLLSISLLVLAISLVSCANGSGDNSGNGIEKSGTVGLPPAEIGDLVLKDGSVVSASNVTADMKDKASGIVIYDKDGTRVIAAVEAFAPLVFSDKSKGGAFGSTEVKALSDELKARLKMPKNDANGNGGVPGVADDWWGDTIKPVLTESGVNNWGTDGAYPILDKLAELNNKDGDGWFIPGVVTCTYIAEAKANADTLLQTLGYSAWPGGTMTSVLVEGQGDFFFYPFSVSGEDLIATRETGAVAKGGFDAAGDFALIDGTGASYFSHTYYLLPVKVLR